MKKVQAPYDLNVIDSFVKELSNNPLLKGYNITEKNANFFNVKLKDHNNCKVCKGLIDCKTDAKGYYNDVVIENDIYKNVVRMCKYKKEKNEVNSKSSLIKTLYMPQNILDARLEEYDFHLSEARKKAFNYVNNFTRTYTRTNFVKGLALIGEFRIGKTYLLASLANELAKKNIESLIIYFPDLSRELKSAMGTPRLDEIVNKLKSIDVLMIDDLGAEMMTPWLRDEIIGPVINYRVGERLPMFISTNLDIAELQEHFEATNQGVDRTKAMRIVARLKEVMTFLKMPDPEYKVLKK